MPWLVLKRCGNCSGAPVDLWEEGLRAGATEAAVKVGRQRVLHCDCRRVRCVEHTVRARLPTKDLNLQGD